MDFGLSKFEIVTAAVAGYLSLVFVCVFLEAGYIEHDLATAAAQEAAAPLIWAAVEADGQQLRLVGAAADDAQRAAALERVRAVPGVAGVEDAIDLVPDGALCQTALDQKLAAGIRFSGSQTEVAEDSFAVLQDVANVAAQCPHRLEVAALTTLRGDAEVNAKLSQRRAENVARYLVRAGVPARQLSAVGVGERQTQAAREQAQDGYAYIEIRVRSAA